MKIYPALSKAMLEPLAADKTNRMLRYDCAYLLGMLQRGDVAKEVLDVMLDYIKDETIEEFASTTSTVGGSSQEGGSGKATSKEQGKGDGRKLALQSLLAIAKDIPARISERRDIVDQVRLLAKDQNTTDEVRNGCKELLKLIK
jgi:hypothetical protein